MLTTFDLARRDIAQLDDLAWSAVFVDEAHRVKNPKSKITQAYNQFACLRRFGLTGKNTLLLEGCLMQRDIQAQPFKTATWKHGRYSTGPTLAGWEQASNGKVTL